MTECVVKRPPFGTSSMSESLCADTCSLRCSDGLSGIPSCENWGGYISQLLSVLFVVFRGILGRLFACTLGSFSFLFFELSNYCQRTDVLVYIRSKVFLGWEGREAYSVSELQLLGDQGLHTKYCDTSGPNAYHSAPALSWRYKNIGGLESQLATGTFRILFYPCKQSKSNMSQFFELFSGSFRLAWLANIAPYYRTRKAKIC
jgi:hypothetical protein